VTFDDPSLMADAGLIVVGALMVRLGLERLIDTTVPVGRSRQRRPPGPQGVDIGGLDPGRRNAYRSHRSAAGRSNAMSVAVSG
jgi:hypothetical protein